MHEKMKGPRGGPAMLSTEDEAIFVDYILYMSRNNFPLTRDDIRATRTVGYVNNCKTKTFYNIINYS